jgi:hypothetical protein
MYFVAAPALTAKLLLIPVCAPAVLVTVIVIILNGVPAVCALIVEITK